MEVHARHDGAALPFERHRRLVLRRLPAGAVVTRATLTLTPVSTDTGRRFLETITLPAGTGAGTWGATKVLTTGAVEVDLHARRRLASLTGTATATAPLLVDLGGGFMAVDATGSFSDGPPFLLGTGELPGLTVTGLRVPAAGAELSALRVSSPPSNVTVAIAGGPVFFTHFGDLVEEVTTPDFADLLQALLPDLDVEHGSAVVPFVVHSDTIARLGLALDLQVELAVAASDVRTVTAAYRYDGVPVGAAGHLAVAVPAGSVATATTGRVQGAFAATRVVHGPVTTAAATTLVSVEAGRALAQPFVTATTEVFTSVDLLLASVTAEARLAVDLVGDLDGKPGRTSLLARPAELALTRDTAGAPTWLSVAMPGEVEAVAGRRTWLVVQSLAGAATWSAAATPAGEGAAGPGPALQHTRDGGLSWRAATGTGMPATVPPAALGAALRLRHRATGFRVPVELRVGAGGGESAVSLQRFAPSGQVDLLLDFPDVAAAVNSAVAAAGGGAPPGEHVANGSFSEWFRIGATPRRGRTVRSDPGGAHHEMAVFSPDGARAHVVGRVFENDRDEVGLVEVDVFAGAALRERVLGDGVPVAVARDGTGRRLAVVATPGSQLSSGPLLVPDALHLIDTATSGPVGVPVDVPPATVALAATADGRGLYLASRRLGQNGVTAVLRHVEWAALEAAAGGAPVDWDAVPRDERPGTPLHVSAGPDGQVALLTETTDDAGVTTTSLFAYRDLGAVRAHLAQQPAAGDVAGARASAWPAGDQLLVLRPGAVTYLRARDLAAAGEVTFEGGATAIGLEATGTLAVLALDDAVGVLDVATRRLTTVTATVSGDGDAAIAVSPAGTHALLTRPYAERGQLVTIGDALPAEWEITAGRVRPVTLTATGEVLAYLGEVGTEENRVADGDGGVGVALKGDRPELLPSSMSQVVPVVGGARYRFAFDGLALVEGAVGQVRWTGAECAPERVDRVPVSVFDASARATLETVPHHEATLLAPTGARSAEVRFFTPESVMLVDHVTLAGSASVATGTWEPGTGTQTTPTPAPPPVAPPPATGQSVTPAGPAGPSVTLTNAGAAEAAVTQRAAVAAGAPWALTLTAVATGTPGARVEISFADELGAAAGETVTMPLDVLDLDAHAAAGTVPAGAVETVLAVVLPPGAEVTVTELSLTAAAPTAVDLYLASEAPGEVSLTDVGITVDVATPTAPPVPPEGLCPPTPAGGGEDGAYCQACGCSGPTGKPRPARTDAGRAARVTACPTCGADRVRLGGRPVGHATTLTLPRFRVVERPLVVARTDDVRVAGRVGGPALVTAVRVEAEVTDVDNIGPARAAALARIGVRDVVTLAATDVRLVAELPGVSDVLAARILADAAAIVRARGRRVPVDL